MSSRAIAVIDQRTATLAMRQVGDLLRTGEFADYCSARWGMDALVRWLHEEVRTGAKRRRIRRAAQLEQAEMMLEQMVATIRDAIGLDQSGAE